MHHMAIYYWAWFDISEGTLRLELEPLVHPKPSFALSEGQIVMECMSAGGENMAARLRTRSTSSFGPEKPRLAELLSIRLEQARRGIITVSRFLDRLSKSQCTLTIVLNEQQISLWGERHAMLLQSSHLFSAIRFISKRKCQFQGNFCN